MDYLLPFSRYTEFVPSRDSESNAAWCTVTSGHRDTRTSRPDQSLQGQCDEKLTVGFLPPRLSVVRWRTSPPSADAASHRLSLWIIRPVRQQKPAAGGRLQSAESKWLTWTLWSTQCVFIKVKYLKNSLRPWVSLAFVLIFSRRSKYRPGCCWKWEISSKKKKKRDVFTLFKVCSVFLLQVNFSSPSLNKSQCVSCRALCSLRCCGELFKVVLTVHGRKENCFVLRGVAGDRKWLYRCKSNIHFVIVWWMLNAALGLLPPGDEGVFEFSFSAVWV